MKGSSLSALKMNALNNAKINLLFKECSDTVQAFRYSTFINNTTFFRTYCPLTFWLADSEYQQANQDEYIEIGGWFGKQGEQVNTAVYNHGIKGLPKLSLEEYSAIEKQASKYRVRLIELLANGITSIPLGQP